MKQSSASIYNVVLGTAGHIDHGKSTLVHRLTGVDPDRLPEEKARGLTIDLGFAPLMLPDGRRVGVVDVPGHERLVKNMVAGATGIDVVLLVVAADDGVMPQTREHLTILQILGLEVGLVALTKTDLVDQEMVDFVREDIAEAVAGTFLEGAPVVAISSATGAGYDDLMTNLIGAVDRVRPKETSGIFRMPIQRVFSRKGFGTVVTGTPVSGRVGIGDVLEIVPLGHTGRVRGLQAYKEPTEIARAGHSTAINLSEVDFHDIRRGMVIAEPGYLDAGTMYEARFTYLTTSRRPLENQTAIRLHVGTAEVLGKIHLLEKETLAPGESSFVQFRLDEPVVALPGDRYVARHHSPMETIGGGEILGRSRHRLKLGKQRVLDRLIREEAAIGDDDELSVYILDQAEHNTLAAKDVAVRSGRKESEAAASLARLEAQGVVRTASRPGQWLLAARLDQAARDAEAAVTAWFDENPLRLLVEASHLKRVLRAGDVFFQDLLETLTRREKLEIAGAGVLRWVGHEPRLTATDSALLDRVSNACREQAFSPPSPDDIASERGADPSHVRALYELLVERGDLRRIAEGIYVHREALDEAKRRLRDYLREHGSVSASDAKTLLGSTRKYSIPLLEHFDREGFTVRRGDLRVLRDET
jgi:selenocysteine-specific elongation factor